VNSPGRLVTPLRLAAGQLDPTNLARDRLGQVGELQPPNPQVGRQIVPGELED
jgi:hypothetical protein